MRIVAGTGGARRAVIGERDLAQADPAHHAADEALLLRHRIENVDDLAAHQPEVAGIDRHVVVGELPQQAVEQSRRAALEHGFTLPLAALAVDDVGLDSIQETPHLAEQFRRILQVGIDGQNAVAAAGMQACRHRALMAMAARQVDRDQLRIALGELEHDLPGAIGRAVIDQDQLVVGADGLFGGRAHAPVKLFEAGFFVVARRNDGQPRARARVLRQRHRYAKLLVHICLVTAAAPLRPPAYGGSRTCPIGPDRL